MKKIFFTLFMVFVLFSCSEKELLTEEVNPVPPQEIPAVADDESFVSSEQAAAIAGKYFSKEPGAATRSLDSAAVEMVADEENGDKAAMYVVNYPEGGWAIISATRNYFPVLAHSDEGYFDMENISESGVSVWMSETKDAVRISETLPDSTKVRINMQWLAYEEAQKKTLSGPQTRGYHEMMNRIDYLYSQYSSQGWYYYYSLDEAYNIFDFSLWQGLVNEANAVGAPTEYTIVAVKSTLDPNQYIKGPLLTTEWSQNYVYNDIFVTQHSPKFYLNIWCPPDIQALPYDEKWDAGCVAVATAQIMNYHKRPQSNFIPQNHPEANLFYPTPGWSHVFNWNNMSVDHQDQTTSSVPVLLRAVGEAVDMSYSPNGSVSSIDKAQNALKNIYGYTTVTKANHNLATVRTNLTANRPVFMRGSPSSGNGHAWVCDGLKYNNNITEYFVEFPVNNSYGSYGCYTPSYPGKIIERELEYFHMNYGEMREYNGWFFGNDLGAPVNNYQYGRQNLYIIP